jgi:hypothetical protein
MSYIVDHEPYKDMYEEAPRNKEENIESDIDEQPIPPVSTI